MPSDPLPQTNAGRALYGSMESLPPHVRMKLLDFIIAIEREANPEETPMDPEDLLRRISTATAWKPGDAALYRGKQATVIEARDADGQFDGLQVVTIEVGGETVVCIGGELDVADV